MTNLKKNLENTTETTGKEFKSSLKLSKNYEYIEDFTFTNEVRLTLDIEHGCPEYDENFCEYCCTDKDFEYRINEGYGNTHFRSYCSNVTLPTLDPDDEYDNVSTFLSSYSSGITEYNGHTCMVETECYESTIKYVISSVDECAFGTDVTGNVFNYCSDSREISILVDDMLYATCRTPIVMINYSTIVNKYVKTVNFDRSFTVLLNIKFSNLTNELVTLDEIDLADYPYVLRLNSDGDLEVFIDIDVQEHMHKKLVKNGEEKTLFNIFLDELSEDLGSKSFFDYLR